MELVNFLLVDPPLLELVNFLLVNPPLLELVKFLQAFLLVVQLLESERKKNERQL
jgi:hypothetical protein